VNMKHTRESWELRRNFIRKTWW